MTRLSCTVASAKGPSPFAVLQIATPDTTNVTTVVPICPKRSAAQMTKGKIV